MKQSASDKEGWKDFAVIAAGTVCMALAVNIVYEPLGMVTGGISGLSIILRRLAGVRLGAAVPVWLFNLLLNIPIFLVALRIKGKRYMKMTLFANLCFTAALFLIPVSALHQKDFVLAAAVGGVLTGMGLGLVFSRGYSTGGTDLLGAVIHHFFPYYPVGQILFALDCVIIAAGACVFGVRPAAYAALAVYLTTHLMDTIVAGGNSAKLAYIISDHYEEIGRTILSQVGRGITVLDGTGMYTGKAKKTLMCVVDRKQISSVCHIARNVDKKAFVIISDIREVQGEGFVEKPQT
jgi:uncharacterized membrane-anchored protein YitT (DUF2179 family)